MATAEAGQGELPAKGGGKIYTVGTLRYSAFGLVMIFVWLLWGDFVWQVFDNAIPGILPLKLHELGAGDTTIAFLNKTLAYAISFFLSPIVSFHSDRYRSRLGRRIPYLIWSTPFVGLFLILIGCYDSVTNVFIGHASSVTLLGFDVGRATLTLIVFGALFVGFDLANIFVNNVYWYLFNDVVPSQYLSRYMSFFRMTGTLAGVFYNIYIFPQAMDNFRTIFIAGGIIYVLGFMLMCVMVREGKYPPPPEHVDKGKGFVSALRTYAKECFSHRFYWYFFITSTFLFLSWQTGLFNLLRNTTTLGLTLAQLGLMGALIAPISFALQYPAGWLADKYHPLRVYFIASAVCLVSTAASCIFMFWDFGTWGNLMAMYAMSVVFMPFALVRGAAEIPMYMRVLPKERYGQFCSANDMVRSFALIFGSLLAGLFMDYIGALPCREYTVQTAEIASTATWQPSWNEQAVGPWSVSWVDATAGEATVTVPGATSVKVYFSEINPAPGLDNVTVVSADNALNAWTSRVERVYSRAGTGESLTLRQKSRSPSTGSFVITKVAWLGTKTGEIKPPSDALASFPLSGLVKDKETGRGLAGVKVSFADVGKKHPAPGPVVTDDNGLWRQTGFASGDAYRIAVSKRAEGGDWEFDPETREVGGALSGDNVTASWKPEWTEEAAANGPWRVNYVDSTRLDGTIRVPGATRVKVFFSEINPEAGGFDNLTTDAGKAGKLDRWGGSCRRDVWSSEKPGDNISIAQVAPDGIGTTGNFVVKKIAWVGQRTGRITRGGAMWKLPDEFPLIGRVVSTADGRGVAGVTVSFKRVDWPWWVNWTFSAPRAVTTDDNGCWTQSGFKNGADYRVTTSKDQPGGTWLFSPADAQVSGAVRGAFTLATWSTPAEWTEERIPTWLMNYTGKLDRPGSIIVPGASDVIVYFSEIKTEPGVDRLTTNAGSSDDWSGPFSGVYSNMKPGDNITVRLVTGDKGKGTIKITKVLYKGKRTGPIRMEGPLWGFALSGVVRGRDGGGLGGVKVTFKRESGSGVEPGPVTTDKDGKWKRDGFRRGAGYQVAFAKTEENGAWGFSRATMGDWHYRWFPVWTVVFQILSFISTILLYREWKKLGGDENYVPPAA